MRLVGVLIASIGILFAHDMWVVKSGNHYTLHYGHLHPSQHHKGAKEISYDPLSVQKVLCFKDGKTKELPFEKKYPVEAEGECDIVVFVMDGGYYTKTPYGLKHEPKSHMKMALKSWHSIESVKYVTKPAMKPISDEFELVLRKEALPEVGEKTRLRLFYKKQPLKNGVVAYWGKPRGTSDENGDINIRVKKHGLQLIAASFSIPCKSDKCDKEIHTTTLVFEAK